MAKLRKMLGSAESPYILTLMRLIETQSKQTIVRWCISYAESVFLPIYQKSFPKDQRLQVSLDAIVDLLDGKLKPAEAKKITKEATLAAKEAEGAPAAQAAARAIVAAVGAFFTPTQSLGMAFYGAAAIAYDRVGLQECNEVYDEIAAEECAKMEQALQAIAIAEEPNQVKINWYC